MCLLSLCRLLSMNVRLDPFAEEMKSEAEKIGVFPEVPQPRSQPRYVHERRSVERLGAEVIRQFPQPRSQPRQVPQTRYEERSEAEASA